MRTLPLITFFIFFINTYISYGQNLLQDAIVLTEATKDIEGNMTLDVDKNVLEVLAKYIKTAEDKLNCDELIKKFDGNPYIGRDNHNPLITMDCAASAARSSIDQFGGAEIYDYKSSYTPISQAMIIDGIADFLVKRMKQELSLAFFDKFKDFLLDTEEGAYAEMLFPATHRTLLAIGDQIYDFDDYLESLREAFLQDLRSLPLQTLELLDDLDLIKKQELKVLLKSSVIITQGIVDGQLAPLALVNELANSLEAMAPDSNFTQYVQLVNFSLNLLMKKGGKTHSFLEIQALQKPTTLKIFLGLAYQLSNSESLKAVLNDVKDNVAPIADFASTMHLRINKITAIAHALDSLSNKTEEDRKNKILLEQEIMDNSIAILERSVSIFDELVPQKLDDKTKTIIDKGVKVLQNIVSIQTNLRLEKYTMAINGIVSLLDNVGSFGDCNSEVSQVNQYNIRVDLLEKYIETEEEKKTARKIRKALKTSVGEFDKAALKKFTKDVENDIQVLKGAIIKRVPKLKKEINQNTRFVFCQWIDKLLKYGSFIAAVAEAKSSAEVSQALEAFALPPGSSRIKKYSAFSVSLNSFVGSGFMLEHTLGKQEWLEGVWTWHAPIGIAVNTGFGKGGALSFYASVLDFGAIVSQKITTINSTSNNQTFPVTQLDFGHIFAPGLFVYYGLPCDLPIAIGFGGQLGPLLTTTNNAGVALSADQKIRFGISLTVDIPITHFYTSGAKPQRRNKK